MVIAAFSSKHPCAVCCQRGCRLLILLTDRNTFPPAFYRWTNEPCSAAVVTGEGGHYFSDGLFLRGAEEAFKWGVNATGAASVLWNDKEHGQHQTSSFDTLLIFCCYPLSTLGMLVRSEEQLYTGLSEAVCWTRALQGRCVQTLEFDHGPPIKQRSPYFLVLLTFVISTASEPGTVTEYH